MEIKGLMDVTCKTVVNMMKGNNAEKIRRQFHIRNDFTETEEEQGHEEIDWF